MFGRKTRKALEQARWEKRRLEEELATSKECHNKAVAEIFLKEKRLDYVRDELVRANREIDSLRGELASERRRSGIFSRRDGSPWLQMFTPSR